jgi:hypothetical protein
MDVKERAGFNGFKRMLLHSKSLGLRLHVC